MRRLAVILGLLLLAPLPAAQRAPAEEPPREAPAAQPVDRQVVSPPPPRVRTPPPPPRRAERPKEPPPERRVALVIGNGAYRHAPALANPRNDAEDMAAALREIGWEVIDGVDLDRAGMEGAVRAFAGALAGASAGIFFYAGHGVQVAGVNHLVPVEAELSTSAALEFETLRLDSVQRIMESPARTSLIFLDACRNNPLTRNLARALGTRSATIGQGLAPAESGVGTLVSFSTQPGNVALDGSGRNSPYSGPLAAAIRAPDMDIVAVLTRVRQAVLLATGGRQVPWEHSALLASFHVVPQASAAAAGAPGSRPTEERDAVLERAPYAGPPKPRSPVEARDRPPSTPRAQPRLEAQPRPPRLEVQPKPGTGGGGGGGGGRTFGGP